MDKKLRRRPAGESNQVPDKDQQPDPTLSNYSSSEEESSEESFGRSGGMPGAVKIAIFIGTIIIVFLLTREPGYFTRIPSQISKEADISESAKDDQTGKTIVNGVTIFTKHELAKFTGADKDAPVLLAFMGKVFDVSKGRRHYGPGGSYQFFSGRDATKAFLTGDFQNDLTDNLDGISDSQFGDIENWETTYSKSKDYKQVGVLCGYFYQCVGDSEPGKPTEKLSDAKDMMNKVKHDAAKDNEIYAEFPQCNSEWSQEKGGRVWCSEKSGGIDRRWAGLPRLFLTQKNGKKSTRCACVHPEKLSDPRVELYPSCRPDSDSCAIQK